MSEAKIINRMLSHGVYQAEGYADRSEYLRFLADDFGIDFEAVAMMADLLGPSEDFDGLITELQDYAE